MTGQLRDSFARHFNTMGPQLQGLWQKTLSSVTLQISPHLSDLPTDAVDDTLQSGDSVPVLRVHKATQTAPFPNVLAYRTAAAQNSSAQDAIHLLYMNTATQTELSSPPTMQTELLSPRTEQTSYSADNISMDERATDCNHDRRAPSVNEQEGQIYIEALTSSKFEIGDGDHASEIVDGPSRVVVTNHNNKPCLALLATKEMIENINEVTRLSRMLAHVEPRYEEADRAVNFTRHAMGYLENVIEDTESQDEIDGYRKDIEQRRSTLIADGERREALHDQVTALKRDLKYYEESSQGMLKEVLDNAGLLTAPIEFESEEEDADKEDGGMGQACGSIAASICSEVSYLSTERLARYAAREEMGERHAEFLEEDHKFENFQEEYEYQKERFQQRLLDDPDFDMSQTEFDLIYLEEQRQLTRNLCVAEGAYEEALARCRKFGPNQWEQESGFVTEEGDGYVNDGYDLSWEVDGPASAPSDYIFGWMKDIPDVEYPPDITKLELGAGLEIGHEDREDVDICDIRSAQLSDTLTSRDTTRNRRRIDRWRAITGRDR